MDSSHYASATLFASLGFEPVSSTTILSLLEKVELLPGTAVRDAIISSISLLLQLNSELLNIGTSHYWNFLNIVISDGEDNSSKRSKSNLREVFYQINQSIPSDRCKIVLVGVGLDRSAKMEYQEYADAGGNNVEYIDAKCEDIEKIFDRLQVDIGIMRKTSVAAVGDSQRALFMASQSYTPIVNVYKRNYAVVFTLDISPSMDEKTGWFTFNTKWKSLKKAVNKFLRTMDNNDLVACVLFHENVYIVTKKEKKKSSCNIF